MIEKLYIWNRLWNRLAKKLAPYSILYLQVGGHCGICGKWVSNVIVERVWAWTLCEECAKGNSKDSMVQK